MFVPIFRNCVCCDIGNSVEKQFCITDDVFVNSEESLFTSNVSYSVALLLQIGRYGGGRLKSMKNGLAHYYQGIDTYALETELVD